MNKLISWLIVAFALITPVFATTAPKDSTPIAKEDNTAETVSSQQEEGHTQESSDHQEGGHHFVETVIFWGGLLVATALLQELCKKISFPFTVAVLLMGFVAQYIFKATNIQVEASLSSDVIFFVLLPALLFGAAMHINLHQFRLQFKTISFAATVGLLISVFTVAFLLPYMIGVPFEVALLFGAIISATDPIAVLALFNTLGAPRRLALLADGESMFNDATGVIAFRIISAIILGGTALNSQTLLSATGNFLYIFIGSILVGSLVGYMVSQLIAKIKEDMMVETTITLGAALLAFAGAEHFFKLSGVITAVMAGLVAGNLGRSRFSPGINKFIRDFWDYLGFLAVAAVFFFATYTLDITQFFIQPHRWLLAVLVLLIARAVSVYAGYFVSNTLSIFKDEPNVPLSWQHILNWGGLRGVIPLVLVFTIPETYAYKQDLFIFTLGSLLFTLIVNGLTIEFILKKLGLHLPKKEEAIEHQEHVIFTLDEQLEKLHSYSTDEFSKDTLETLKTKLNKKLSKHKEKLLNLTTAEELEKSLRLQLLKLERQETDKLFQLGYINENVLYEFDAQLDLQLDALEYPEVVVTRATDKQGKLASKENFRTRLFNLRRLSRTLPILRDLFEISEDQLVTERYSLLRARLITSEQALAYLDRVAKLLTKKEDKLALEKVRKTYQGYVTRNKKEFSELATKHSSLVHNYQEKLLSKLVEHQPLATSGH